MSLRVVAPASSMGVHEGVHTVFSRCSEILVGAPRFELGTPCTPCKCATRLRHAPNRLFLSKDHSHGGDRRAGRQSYATSRGGRMAPEISASQDLHQLFELDPHLLDDLLALREIGARFLAGELVARAADGEALVIEQAPDLAD